MFYRISPQNAKSPADCGAIVADARAAAAQFAKYPEVWGFDVYSVGGGTQWTDVTPCLGQL
jgi:hypothetical protein